MRRNRSHSQPMRRNPNRKVPVLRRSKELVLVHSMQAQVHEHLAACFARKRANSPPPQPLLNK